MVSWGRLAHLVDDVDQLAGRDVGLDEVAVDTVHDGGFGGVVLLKVGHDEDFTVGDQVGVIRAQRVQNLVAALFGQHQVKDNQVKRLTPGHD